MQSKNQAQLKKLIINQDPKQTGKPSIANHYPQILRINQQNNLIATKQPYPYPQLHHEWVQVLHEQLFHPGQPSHPQETDG